MIAVLSLSGSAFAKQVCEEIEVNDRIEIVCTDVFSCDDFGLTEEQLAQCGELCANPQFQGTAVCIGLGFPECQPGERLVDRECIHDVPPDLVAMAGEMCVSRQIGNRALSVAKRAEKDVELRLQLLKALSATQLIGITLPDGRTVSASPESASPDSKKLRDSVEALARKQGIFCKVTQTPLESDTCNRPLSNLISTLREEIDGQLQQLNTIAQEHATKPNFGQCVDQAIGGARALNESLGRGADASAQFFLDDNFQAALERGEGELIRLDCTEPDIHTCRIGLTRPPPPPVPPTRGIADL